jgi:hypothetical protein
MQSPCDIDKDIGQEGRREQRQSKAKVNKKKKEVRINVESVRRDLQARRSL